MFDASKPLWLPEGSIRALIAIGTLSLIGIQVLRGMTVPEWLIPWGVMILSDYYKSRQDNGTSK